MDDDLDLNFVVEEEAPAAFPAAQRRKSKSWKDKKAARKNPTPAASPGGVPGRRPQVAPTSVSAGRVSPPPDPTPSGAPVEPACPSPEPTTLPARKTRPQGKTAPERDSEPVQTPPKKVAPAPKQEVPPRPRPKPASPPPARPVTESGARGLAAIANSGNAGLMAAMRHRARQMGVPLEDLMPAEPQAAAPEPVAEQAKPKKEAKKEPKKKRADSSTEKAPKEGVKKKKGDHLSVEAGSDFRKKDIFRPDIAPADEEVRGADDAEDFDVLAAVSNSLKRDAALEEELTKPSARRDEDPMDVDERIMRSTNATTSMAKGGTEKKTPRQVIPGYNSDSSDDDAGGEGAKKGGGVVSFLRKGEVVRTAEAQRKRNREREAEREKLAKAKAEKEEQEPPKKKRVANRISVKYAAGELIKASNVVGAGTQEDVYGKEQQGFSCTGLDEAMCTYLTSINYTRPTRVQQAAIPVILEGKDVVVKAPTGSGKTLTFLAPLVQMLASQDPKISRREGTHAIIMSPTRELAIQINDTLQLLVKRYRWLVSGLLIGGDNRNHEKARLRKGVIIVVATPGRLLDHLQSTAAFQTAELQVLVLDEADRLLDLGFKKAITEILMGLEKRCADRFQRVLASATITGDIPTLCGLDMQTTACVGFSPEDLRLGGDDAGKNFDDEGETADGADAPTKLVVPKHLTQRFIDVPCKLRLVTLVALLRFTCRKADDTTKVVVFLSTCDGVEYHYRLFADVYRKVVGEALIPVPLFKLHGNLPQGERSDTFVRFSRAKAGVLLCTDVAARGLDFPAVSHIVQFDPPGEPTEYVHRAGRTARMGQAGTAIMFLMQSELEYRDRLAELGLEVEQQQLLNLYRALPQADAHGNLRASEAGSTGKKGAKDERTKSGKAVARAVFVSAHALQNRFMSLVSEDRCLTALAHDAFRSFVRSYAAFPSSMKSIFHPKKLHLGHVAHSFALSEAPSVMGRSQNKNAQKKEKNARHMKAKSGGKKR